MAIINFTDIKKQGESANTNESPESINTGKATITDPELIAKFKELEQKEKTSTGTVKESRQYYRLKKYGDAAPAKNKLLQEPTNRPTQIITLEQANNNPITPTPEKLQAVTESVFNGLNVIDACKVNDIRPKDFFNWLDRDENIKEKKKYFSARCCLAEYYLYRRESLEKDLLSGKIDSSTYSTLANDYKYLAGKLAPLAYGDKIQFDAQIVKADISESINADKIKQLNNLLQSNIIDAEFTEDSNG